MEDQADKSHIHLLDSYTNTKDNIQTVKSQQRTARKRPRMSRIRSLYYKEGMKVDTGNRKQGARKGLITILLLVACLSVGLYFVTNYKSTKFRMNSVKDVQHDIIKEQVSDYMQSQLYFNLDTSELETMILEKNSLVKEVGITKSIAQGLVINITEYTPLAYVQHAPSGTKYIATEEAGLIKYSSISAKLYELQYTGAELHSPFMLDFVRKSIKFIDLTAGIGYIGTYSFDNFGNFSILTPNQKIIKADLKESYFTIDEQFKVFQNALTEGGSFSEINLRFKYLVVKK